MDSPGAPTAAELLGGLGAVNTSIPGLAKLLACLLNEAPLPLWIYDAANLVVYNNHAGCDWGSGGSTLGKGLDSFSSQVRAILQRGIEHCRASGQRVADEGWVKSEVFGYSYLEFSFIPLPDGLVAVSPNNLTERKRVEQALQRSEERVRFFAEILERSLVAFGAAEPDGRLVMANRAFCELTGYSESELRQISFFEELTTGDSADSEAQALRLLAQSGQAGPYEKAIPRADGSSVPVEVFVQQIADETGCARRVFFFVTDISQRKQAEQALHHSEERLALALEGAADGIWDYDCTTGRMFRSSRVTKLLGYALEELPPTTEAWFQLVHPDDQVRVRQAWQAHLAGETEQYSVEHRLRAKTGDYLCVQDSGKVVSRAADGRPLRAAGTHKDITERKLIQEQLVREQKEQMLTTLAGGIAHDFNNILVGIVGTASLLAETIPADDPSRELCSLITTSAQRMAELTGELLAYARGGKFQPQPVDVRLLAAEALSMSRMNIPASIERVNEITSDLWPVLADAGQLLQVLLNLLVNAGEAIGASAGQITVRGANVTLPGAWRDVRGLEHPAGQYVCLSVSDTGCGMDEDTLRQAFEPFFSTKARGRGLGLAAVNGIIGQHGGGIVVRNNPDAGCTFTVYLPHTGETMHKQQQESEHKLSGQETILIVDDDKTVLLVLRLMLERLGYHVLSAADGAQALLLCREHGAGVALAVIDVHLLEENGFTVLASLRREQPGLPALMSSGFSEELVRPQPGLDQHTEFVQKPYDVAFLARKIRELLDATAPA